MQAALCDCLEVSSSQPVMQLALVSIMLVDTEDASLLLAIATI